MNVAAYELRSNYFEENGDSEVAQHQVRTLFKMFNDPGLDQVVGETKGLVPLNREALDEGLWKALPKSRVVLGYSQPFEAADGTLEQLREIASEGYRLALSGNLSTECLETFSHPSHTLVVNVTDYKPDELQDRVAGLREFKSTITAAGVDTYDDLEFCKALQFDYYQGHFLFKPAVKRQSIPVNRLTMLRLLSKLHDPRIQISEVEKLVAQDVALSYKILRYTNSAFVALRRQVSSAGHAVR
ncbi:MAG TPA: HDOD domain-containing protein, partial [Terriglobia bacterium]|nr:HDOD domain-containing protein [Terriglobia bacterium]